MVTRSIQIHSTFKRERDDPKIEKLSFLAERVQGSEREKGGLIIS